MTKTKKKSIFNLKSIFSKIGHIGTIGIALFPVKTVAISLWLGGDLASGGLVSGIVGIIALCAGTSGLVSTKGDTFFGIPLGGKLKRIQPIAKLAMKVLDYIGSNHGKAANDPKINK